MLQLAPSALVSVLAKVTEVTLPEKLLKRDKTSYVTKQDSVSVIGDATAACRLVSWLNTTRKMEFPIVDNVWKCVGHLKVKLS